MVAIENQVEAKAMPIVDDEPIAREIIQTYCIISINLQVVVLRQCSEAKLLLQTQFKLMILRTLMMPVLSGIAFKNTKTNPCVNTFTTAYK